MKGKDVRQLREDRGMSKAHLAGVLGKDYRTVHRWEQKPDKPIPTERCTIIVLELLRDDELPMKYHVEQTS